MLSWSAPFGDTPRRLETRKSLPQRLGVGSWLILRKYPCCDYILL